MKPWINISVACIVLCLVAGCSANRSNQDLLAPSSANRDLIAPTSKQQDGAVPSPTHRELIVLLPDPDGKVGTLRVTNQSGSQVLDKPGLATEIEGTTQPPNTPYRIDGNDLVGVFGPALSAQPDPVGRFVSFILYFKTNTTRLTRESKDRVPEVVRTIETRKSGEIYVVGHTDRVGPEVYNTELSSRRAHTVRDLLASRGIQLEAFVVSFHGESMPQIETEDEVAEPLNRRVEVFVR